MRVRLYLVIPALLVLLAACSGGGSSEGSGVPRITSADAQRDVENGAAQLTSTVRVHLDRNARLAPSRVPLASQFELDIPDPFTNEGRRVLVQAAELDPEDPRTVLLHVDSLVTAGTTLKMERRAFLENAEGQETAEVQSNLAPELVILASTPLVLTDPSFLDDPQEPEVTPADRDPEAMRAALQQALDARGASAETEARALGRYASIPEDIVPSPKARAALAGLTGTFAEAAIDSLLTPDNCTGKPAAGVLFQVPPGAPSLIAREVTGPDGRRTISLNPSIEGERIEFLMVILAHESIHCDAYDGRLEEAASIAVETFLYLQLVAADPALARAGTPLARDMDINAIAMINSGRALPESVGVLKSVGVARALPGTNSPHASLADLAVAAYPQITYNDSPDEPVAKAYSAALASVAGVKEGSPFDLRYLDELLGRAMDPRVLFEAINAFGLAPANPD
jgi:hypothetical protein